MYDRKKNRETFEKLMEDVDFPVKEETDPAQDAGPEEINSPAPLGSATESHKGTADLLFEILFN